MMKRAFTLTELLIVVAVVAVLAAILFPVVGAARLGAKRTVSLSNLRQCGVALLLYEGEHGDFPDANSVDGLLRDAPTCDPNDFWRPSCETDFGTPLVGSYAYLRKVFPDADAWSEFRRTHPRSMLLASVYYASTRPKPYHGDLAPFDVRNQDAGTLPERVLSLGTDGSASSLRYNPHPTPFSPGTTTTLRMSWTALFYGAGYEEER